MVIRSGAQGRKPSSEDITDEEDDASNQKDRYDIGMPPSLGYDYGIRFKITQQRH